MFNKERLSEAFDKYKQRFDIRWPEEMYKWEAVKCFQDNWDIDADDFADMLSRSLAKTGNLLMDGRTYSRDRILTFSAIDVSLVRSMFVGLYDEDKDVYERISRFKEAAEQFRLDHLSELKAQNRDNGHYQGEKTISIYLWLKFPDKYYSFKFTELQNAALWLESDYKFKQGAYDANMRSHYAFCVELNEAVKKDTDLSTMLKNNLTDWCYPDTELHALTFDIIFFIGRELYKKDQTSGHATSNAEWLPVEYSPNISVDKWREMISDKDIFNENSLAIMKRIKDYGGIATCTQLAAKYGEEVNFYNSGSVSLARRVVDKTKCPVSKRKDGSVQWWAILYEGQNADSDDDGTFLWKLRKELAEAISDVSFEEIPLYTKHEPKAIRYWLYAPGHGAEKWDEFYKSGIMGIGWDEIGDLSVFNTKDEMKQAMKINYDLYHGKLHMSDLRMLLNPYDLDASFIPDAIQHYSVMNSKLNVLRGEESDRPFDFRAVVTNPNAISEVEENKNQGSKKCRSRNHAVHKGIFSAGNKRVRIYPFSGMFNIKS